MISQRLFAVGTGTENGRVTSHHSLFECLCFFEQVRYQLNGVGLDGLRLLQSDLQHFNCYLAECLEHKMPLENTSFSFNDLTIETIQAFPYYLYQKRVLCSYGAVRESMMEFVDWLYAQHHEFDLDRVILKSVLSSGFAEVARLTKIFREMQRYRSNRLYPEPIWKLLENPCDDNQLELFNVEKPLELEEINDTFTVQSKSSKGSLVFLKSGNSGECLGLKAAENLVVQIRKDDRIPLTLGKTWDGTWFLMHFDLPLIREDILPKSIIMRK